MNSAKDLVRCEWCGSDSDYIAYHDKEWGVPLHDDTKLFELLTLEGAQAGLSWLTVLRRRQGYRSAFDKFNINKIAKYTDSKIAKLLEDPGIIRNKLKVSSTVSNAKATLAVQKEFGSLDSYLWGFVGGKPIQNHRAKLSDLPSRSDAAESMSKDLRKRGFNFIGPTICYAFMQSSGMVNDHIKTCFRYSQLT